MKKLKTAILSIMILIFLASCSSTSIPPQELLKADGKQLERKLPYLDNLNRRDSGNNAIECQSMPYTIWERELRQNILDDSTEKFGSIEIVEICRKEKPSFFKTKCYITTCHEIRIYDNDGRMAWSSTYCQEGSCKVPHNGSNGNSAGRNQEEARMMKSVIEDFKKDVTVEYESIVKKLEM